MFVSDLFAKKTALCFDDGFSFSPLFSVRRLCLALKTVSLIANGGAIYGEIDYALCYSTFSTE
jgi:hypothetical protein